MKRVKTLFLLSLAAAPAPLNQAITDFNHADYTHALPLLQPLAAAGNRQAESDLGYMYYLGLGVAQDGDAAFYLQNQAARQNYPPAEIRLGDMYRDIDDYNNAFIWFSKAAAAGDPVAEHRLGWEYEFGYGVTANETTALDWYLKSAAQNNAQRQYDLATMYDNGYGTAKNTRLAFHYYMLAANQGETDAENAVGEDYENGAPVPQDYAKALHWFKLAQNESCGCAEDNIGYMYENGLGVPQSNATALTWYQRGASLGNSNAQRRLGDFYHQGTGIPIDNTKAAYWYGQASSQGDNEATISLALLYRDGLGVEQNPTEAKKLIREAEQDTDPDDEQQMAWAMRQDHDDAEALPLFTNAANRSNPYSQIDLGYMYEQGQAVKQSFQTELSWALITGSMIDAPNPPDSGYDPTEVMKFVNIHIGVALPHLNATQIATARATATTWLTANGYTYDDSLLPNPKPGWPAYAEIIAGILIIYALVKLNAKTKLRPQN
jgi:TPR repeat protein